MKCLVLAAGIGKRMKSNVPKVLHPILGIPMINYVVEALGSLKSKEICVVV
ncbi:MAG: NTP transferase domain-containing protein, partial [Candidatus Dadabacteria bacterium]|nr:NTP transferase domain-containing protein [Candidatus Dadabacteria bacterium]NIT13626.1 NTP transferase domain-containing protein [Candidatus Dadabacteria bacterium]